MSSDRKPKNPVTHRPKGDKKPSRTLAEEPAMQALERLVQQGKVSRARTVTFLRSKP